MSFPQLLRKSRRFGQGSSARFSETPSVVASYGPLREGSPLCTVAPAWRPRRGSLRMARLPWLKTPDRSLVHVPGSGGFSRRTLAGVFAVPFLNPFSK